MNIGKKNRRIKLYSTLKVSDGIGGYTETPTLLKTTWASVIPLSQREILLYGLEVGVRAYKIGIRFDINYDIDQNNYFVYTDRFGNDKTLRVISVLDTDETASEMIILANVRTD